MTTPLPRLTGVGFPNDDPQDVLLQAVAAIRREMGYIAAALDAVMAAIGAENRPSAPDSNGADRSAERDADARYAARLAASGIPASDPRIAVEWSDWTCPDHGIGENATTLTKRLRYRRCPTSDCREFEMPQGIPA